VYYDYDDDDGGVIGEKKCLNSELWHACAGPLVSLPTAGSRVVYFPQGHSEQVFFFFSLSIFIMTLISSSKSNACLFVVCYICTFWWRLKRNELFIGSCNY
jgi:hypothetical protein